MGLCICKSLMNIVVGCPVGHATRSSTPGRCSPAAIHEPESNPIRDHPLRVLKPPSPCLNKCSELSTLHDPMVRAPAHPNFQPPLSLSILIPIHVPHPLGPSNRHN